MPTNDKQPCFHRWDIFIGEGSEIEATCSFCQHGVFEFRGKEIEAILQLAQGSAPERLAVILGSCKQRASAHFPRVTSGSPKELA